MSRIWPPVGVSVLTRCRPNDKTYVGALAKSGYWISYNGTAGFPSAWSAVDISQRTYSFSTRAGRNYELGRAENGELNLSVDNTDRLFDNTNASSPLYGYVKPFLPIQVVTAMNTPSSITTGNFINDTNVATNSWSTQFPYLATVVSRNASPVSVEANDGNFESTTATINWECIDGALSRSTAFAWQGSASLRYVTSSTGGWCWLDVPVVAGQTYVVSAYIRGVGTFRAFDGIATLGTGSTAVTVNSSTSFTRYSTTITPKSNRIAVAFQHSGTNTSYLDGVQVEIGTTASTYTTTGPTVYPLFTGFIERFPNSFDAPNRGKTNLVATDILANMSQVALSNLYKQAIIGENALFYYPFSDNEGSTYASNESAYAQPPLQTITDTQGYPLGGDIGQVVFGNEDAKFGIPGAATTGVYFQTGANGDTYLNTDLGYATELVFEDATQQLTTITKTYEVWFTPDTDASLGGYIFEIVSSLGNNVEVFSYPTNVQCFVQGSAVGFTLHNNLIAGRWYFMRVVVTNTASNFTLTSHVVGLNYDDFRTTTISGSAYNPVYGIKVGRNANSNIAHLAIYNGSLTSTVQERYDLGKYGLEGEALSAQFVELFDNAGFSYVPINAETSISYGGIMNWLNGTKLFDAAQNVVDSESSTMAVDGDGTLVFVNRYFRPSQYTYAYTFADNSSDAQYVASEIIINYDPTYVINDVSVSRNNGITSTAFDSQSTVDYFPRSYQKTIYNSSDLEAIDAAYYLKDKYKDPIQRVESVTLTPSNNSSVWETALAVNLNDYVLVRKRQMLTNTYWDFPSYVERVEHTVDGIAGTWITRLTVSPEIKKYNYVGANRWTNNTAFGAGTTSLSLNNTYNVRDWWFNRLQVGQVLTVEPNTVRRENVVVSSIPVQGTNSRTDFNILPLPNYDDDTRFGTVLVTAGIDAGGVNTQGASGWVIGSSRHYLIGMEIAIGTWNGAFIAFSTRGAYGTIKEPLPKGKKIFQFDASASLLYTHPLGSDIYDYVPTNLVASSIPNDLLDSDILTIAPQTVTTYTPASSRQYSGLTISGLLDGLNIPAADFTATQLFWLYSNATASYEYAAFISANVPTSDTSWRGMFYKLSTTTATLLAELDMTTTTVTLSGNSPAGTIIAIIDNEFMTVTAGAGTNSLTVTRGTPDSATWGIFNIAPHYPATTNKVVRFITSSSALTGNYTQGGVAYIETTSNNSPMRLIY